MIEDRLGPFDIKKGLKAFRVLLDKPSRLSRKFTTRTREIVKGDRFKRRRHGQTKHLLAADQKSCLTQRVLTLKVHGAFDDRAPMEHAAVLQLTVRHAQVLVSATKREYVDLVSIDVETTQGVDQSNHNRVIRPDAPVGEMPSPVPVGGKEGWGGGRRQRHSHEFFLPVEPEIRVVRCLEDVDLGEAIKCWDVQALLDRPHGPAANAEIAQIEAGLKSRTQAIAERGYDAEQVDAEIAREREREKRLGLDFRRPGSPAQGPGASGQGTGDANVTNPTSTDPTASDTSEGQNPDAPPEDS